MAVIVMLAAAWTHAADSSGRFAVKGAGAASCERYLTAIAEDRDELRLFIGWIDGYLSAVNELQEDTYDLASFESARLLAELLRVHCQANPGQAFRTAVALMTRALKPSRLPAYSEYVPAEHDGHAARVYATTLVRAQLKLAQAGYYKGDAHGQFDRATRRAFERFQKAREIPVTGVPDVGTLALLLRD